MALISVFETICDVCNQGNVFAEVPVDSHEVVIDGTTFDIDACADDWAQMTLEGVAEHGRRQTTGSRAKTTRRRTTKAKAS